MARRGTSADSRMGYAGGIVLGGVGRETIVYGRGVSVLARTGGSINQPKSHVEWDPPRKRDSRIQSRN